MRPRKRESLLLNLEEAAPPQPAEGPVIPPAASVKESGARKSRRRDEIAAAPPHSAIFVAVNCPRGFEPRGRLHLGGPLLHIYARDIGAGNREGKSRGAVRQIDSGRGGNFKAAAGRKSSLRRNSLSAFERAQT